jgi:hypothetical protein
MVGERCENCGREIGKLETPMLWNDRIVCVKCRIALAEAYVASQAHPLQYAQPAPEHSVQTIEKTGKKWKRQMLFAAGLCIIGIFVSCAGVNGGPRGNPLGQVGVLMIIVGFFWGIVARVFAWWHHG